MFMKFGTLSKTLVAKVRTIRQERAEIAADKVIATDPCANEVFGEFEGKPETYLEFNRRLRRNIHEAP